MSTKNKPGIHLYKIRRLKPVRKKKGMKSNLVMADHWYWHVIAKNGRTIAHSSKTYTRKSGAVKSISIAAKIFDPIVSKERGAFHMYYDHSKKQDVIL